MVSFAGQEVSIQEQELPPVVYRVLNQAVDHLAHNRFSRSYIGTA